MALDEGRRVTHYTGSSNRLEQHERDRRTVPPASSITDDLSMRLGRAWRMLRRNPGFAIIVVLTLAIGVGANTAIFSLAYTVLLKPLPFHQPERLVGVWHRSPALSMSDFPQSPALYFAYRENNRVFEDIGVWDTMPVSITGRGEPERVSALLVSDATLDLLRVRPLLGRLFAVEDDAPGAPRRTVLTYGYWQRKFGGAPDIVGQPVHVDGHSREVIGVLPSSFRFLDADPALLLPVQLNRAEAFVGNFAYQALARLKPGVTIERANDDIARMIPLALERFPMPPGFTRKMFDDLRLEPNVRPLSDDVTGDLGTVLWPLLGTAAIVLLIACVNVANLCLVRAEGRQQEMAVRSALGASRGRLARALLSECVMLGLVGGALGLVLARAAIALLVWLAPADLPRLDEVGLDPVVLLFTLVISGVSGLIFGAAPVLKLGSPCARALNAGGRSMSEGPERHRVQNALVVLEIALALVLLIASGLMIRTFVALRQVDPGFVRPGDVLTFTVSVPDGLISDPRQTARTYQQVSERLLNVPGVVSVGLSSSITMDGREIDDVVFAENVPAPGGEMPPARRYKWIAPGYFEMMGNKLLVGRTITWDDLYQGAPVALVSESLAREYWQTPARAIGKRISGSRENPWREIVGVVADERDDGLHRPAPTIAYWPMLMKEFWFDDVFVWRTMSYAVRSERLRSSTFLREIQQAVWSANPNLALANVRTLSEIRSESMAQTSFALVMLGVAAAVALLLGLVGVYGVIACIATTRTREIGIRMALGAQAPNVRQLFLRLGLWLALTGIILGVGAALVLTRAMSALLFGVDPMDPITYIAGSIGLAAVALLATYLPAHRASRIDPVVALRSDL